MRAESKHIPFVLPRGSGLETVPSFCTLHRKFVFNTDKTEMSTMHIDGVVGSQVMIRASYDAHRSGVKNELTHAGLQF